MIMYDYILFVYDDTQYTWYLLLLYLIQHN
jgi:hypothetical protein